MDEKEFYEEKEKMLSMAIKGIDEIFFEDILKIKNLCDKNGLSREFLMLFDGCFKHSFIISDTYLSLSLHNILMKRAELNKSLGSNQE